MKLPRRLGIPFSRGQEPKVHQRRSLRPFVSQGFEDSEALFEKRTSVSSLFLAVANHAEIVQTDCNTPAVVHGLANFQTLFEKGTSGCEIPLAPGDGTQILEGFSNACLAAGPEFLLGIFDNIQEMLRKPFHSRVRSTNCRQALPGILSNGFKESESHSLVHGANRHQRLVYQGGEEFDDLPDFNPIAGT